MNKANGILVFVWRIDPSANNNRHCLHGADDCLPGYCVVNRLDFISVYTGNAAEGITISTCGVWNNKVITAVIITTLDYCIILYTRSALTYLGLWLKLYDRLFMVSLHSQFSNAFPWHFCRAPTFWLQFENWTFLEPTVWEVSGNVWVGDRPILMLAHLSPVTYGLSLTALS